MASETCTSGEHIECDGTTPAADVPGWWDTCPCNCHPAPATTPENTPQALTQISHPGTPAEIPEKRENE